MRIALSQLSLPAREVKQWRLDAPQKKPARAPLSDFLRATPEFTRQLLPQSRSTIAAINCAARTGLAVPASEATRSQSLYSVVGQAVDRGVLHLSGVDIAQPAITWLRGRGPASRQIADAIARYRLPSRGHFHSEAYLGWLAVLGMLDPVRRGYRPLSDINSSLLPRHISPRAARLWFERIIPPQSLAEIAALLRNVRDTRIGGDFFPNPRFGGIGPVIASDGDWISGDTLVELKCTQAGAQAKAVAQLICYFAFDRSRSHGHAPFGFTRLALCLPRQGVLVHGSADEWLAAFGAPPAVHVITEVARWLAAT